MNDDKIRDLAWHIVGKIEAHRDLHQSGSYIEMKIKEALALQCEEFIKTIKIKYPKGHQYTPREWTAKCLRDHFVICLEGKIKELRGE